MPKTKPTHHTVFVVAKIHGLGCLDMFRYDNCCPANEEESNRLYNALRSSAAWIIFKRFVATGAPEEPAVGRWRSFNIPCIPTAFKDFYEAERFRDTASEDVKRSMTNFAPGVR